MAATQRGLKEQMENAGVKWGFAVHKKRGTTNVGEYYAVLPVELMMEILDAALEYEGSRHPERRKRVIPRLAAVVIPSYQPLALEDACRRPGRLGTNTPSESGPPPTSIRSQRRSGTPSSRNTRCRSCVPSVPARSPRRARASPSPVDPLPRRGSTSPPRSGSPR